MIKSKFKKVTSLLMAALMCVTAFAGIGTTTVMRRVILEQLVFPIPMTVTAMR